MSKNLSEDMASVAAGLRRVRAQLYELLAQDQLPPWAIPDARTVQLLGLDVALALDALVDAPPRPKSPLDERR
jgi:hypothetical protein